VYGDLLLTTPRALKEVPMASSALARETGLFRLEEKQQKVCDNVASLLRTLLSPTSNLINLEEALKTKQCRGLNLYVQTDSQTYATGMFRIQSQDPKDPATRSLVAAVPTADYDRVYESHDAHKRACNLYISLMLRVTTAVAALLASIRINGTMSLLYDAGTKAEEDPTRPLPPILGAPPAKIPPAVLSEYEKAGYLHKYKNTNLRYFGPPVPVGTRPPPPEGSDLVLIDPDKGLAFVKGELGVTLLFEFTSQRSRSEAQQQLMMQQQYQPQPQTQLQQRGFNARNPYGDPRYNPYRRSGYNGPSGYGGGAAPVIVYAGSNPAPAPAALPVAPAPLPALPAPAYPSTMNLMRATPRMPAGYLRNSSSIGSGSSTRSGSSTASDPTLTFRFRRNGSRRNSGRRSSRRRQRGGAGFPAYDISLKSPLGGFDEYLRLSLDGNVSPPRVSGASTVAERPPEPFDAVVKRMSEAVRKGSSTATQSTMDPLLVKGETTWEKLQVAYSALSATQQGPSLAAYRAFLLASAKSNEFGTTFCKDDLVGKPLTDTVGYAMLQSLYFDGYEYGSAEEQARGKTAWTNDLIDIEGKSFTVRTSYTSNGSPGKFDDFKFTEVIPASHEGCKPITNLEDKAVLLSAHRDLRALYDKHVQWVYGFLVRFVYSSNMEGRDVVRFNRDFMSPNNPKRTVQDNIELYIGAARKRLLTFYARTESIYNGAIGQLRANVKKRAAIPLSATASVTPKV
jgi:hypothetical protein